VEYSWGSRSCNDREKGWHSVPERKFALLLNRGLEMGRNLPHGPKLGVRSWHRFVTNGGILGSGDGVC